MSQGIFQMRLWQKKLYKSMILSALSGSHVKQNQYPAVLGTLNVTNYPKRNIL